ncbi:hypothetical protein ACLBXO_06905 [Methylobacterium sp. C33D]
MSAAARSGTPAALEAAPGFRDRAARIGVGAAARVARGPLDDRVDGRLVHDSAPPV